MSGTSPDPAQVTSRPLPLPAKAFALSLLLPGLGHLYCRLLDRAILIWMWGAILLGSGIALLFLGLLDSLLPAGWTRPPLAGLLRTNAGTALLAWVMAAVALWIWSANDSRSKARAIRAGELAVVHSLRRQAVHVVGSQLLGAIPFAGIFFAPAVIAEATDSLVERRRPNREHLVREGGQAIRDWVLLRVTLYLLQGLFLLWLLTWIARAIFRTP